MNHLIANKKNGREISFVKLISDEIIFELPEDLNNPHVYDTNYKLEDDEWFGISSFSSSDYCIELLTNDFTSAEYLQIETNDYSYLKYLCSHQDDRYFHFQKLTPKQTIKRKWFKIDNEPQLMDNDPIIVLKTYADAIYCMENDILYFKRISSLSSIFPDIIELYREATQEDTERFLENSFINLSEDYEAVKVKSANRKRIAMAMDTMRNFTVSDKEFIYGYIKEYCEDLDFSDNDKNFEIGSEENLKQLLFGIEQRYYTTHLGNEKRLANSVTAI